jgi:hypothetical protein
MSEAKHQYEVMCNNGAVIHIAANRYTYDEKAVHFWLDLDIVPDGHPNKLLVASVFNPLSIIATDINQPKLEQPRYTLSEFYDNFTP